MNRKFHRIVFNATRGLRMVVQETARSIGRGTRKATRGGTGAAVSMVATLAALASSAPLHAQIHADPDAPGRQRATVLLAPNGVPLVDIQTPSAAGVSRNVYRQFDIDAKGVILNNSRTSVQTQLGGVVQGNPWLARGPARVIVNEVNSNDPTYLRGFVEVAGSRADVIVANPSGISVNGGGFINAYRATLTTGAPQYGASGSLEGYLVRGGTVSIGGAGLDASATDSLAILARAFDLSATLHAADLEVVAGANRIDADLVGIVPIAGTGAAPTYAIDVAHLGGMYAGHIALVVNEAGVGARNAGTIQTAAGGYTLTGAGRLTLSASGRLENSGMIQAASDATIDVAGLANSGTVQSAASLRIATQGDLANHVDATGGTLEGARVEVASAAGDIDNRGGTVRQTSAAALVVSAARLSNTQAGFVGAPPVAQSATTGAGAASGGSGSATAPTSSGSNDSSAGTGSSGGSGGTVSSGSSGGADGDGGTGSTPAATPTVIAPGTLTAAGAVLNDGGRIHAGGDVTLRTPIVDNAGGVLRVATMAVSGPVFGNAGGTLHVTNTFAADVAGFDNAGGTLRAGTLAIATTGDLDNRGGTLASDGAARLGVGGRLDNARGTVSAVDALDATVAGAVDNTAGRLLGNAAVSVAAGVLDNTLGAVQSAAGATRLAVADRLLNDRGGIGAGTDLLVRAGSLANTGTMRAERDGTLAVANGLANGGGIVSGRDTTVTAGRLDGGAAGVLGAGVAVDGTLGSAGDLSVTTTGSLTTAGTLIAADARSAEHVTTLTSRDAATANGALVNTLTLQQAKDIPKQQQEAQARQQAAQLVGSVIDNAIGDVSARMGWEEGSAQKVVLHGLAGIMQAKLGDGGALAGMAAGALNEAVLPAMADYLEGQGVHRYNPDGSVNAEFGALLTAGSTLVGAAVGAVGGDAGLGATVASNATVNNRLLHENEKAKIKQLANGDAVLEQQLTDAACFMAQCSAGKADGDPAKAAAQAMEQAVAANTNGEYTRALALLKNAQIQAPALFVYSEADQRLDALNSLDPRNVGALNTQETTARNQNLLACRGAAGCIDDVNERYDRLVSDRSETVLSTINAINAYNRCAGGDTGCVAESLVQIQALQTDLKARGVKLEDTERIGLNSYIASAQAALGNGYGALSAAAMGVGGARANEAGNAGAKSGANGGVNAVDAAVATGSPITTRFVNGVTVVDQRTALLHKPELGCSAPYPRRSYATRTVSGVPSWVNRLRIETRTCSSVI